MDLQNSTSTNSSDMARNNQIYLKSEQIHPIVRRPNI